MGRRSGCNALDCADSGAGSAFVSPPEPTQRIEWMPIRSYPVWLGACIQSALRRLASDAHASAAWEDATGLRQHVLVRVAWKQALPHGVQKLFREGLSNFLDRSD